MGSGLAIGDDQAHGLGIAVTVEESTGEHEGVVEVGALDVARRKIGELLGVHRAREVGEGDHLEGIERVRRRRERLQRHGGRLGRAPGVVHHHGERLVDEQCDRRARAGLGLAHLEVVGGQPGGSVREPAAHGIAHRAHHVEGLLVAELPGPRLAGELPGGASIVDVVIAARARTQVGEDTAQRRASDAPHGLGAELGALGEVALLAQLALDLAQPLDVVDSLAAEGTLHRLDVDVVEGRTRIVLRELRLEGLEIGHLRQRLGGIGQAEAALALHALAPLPGKVRTQCPQVILQLRHLRGEVEVLPGLLHEPGELLALLRGHRVEHALHRRGPAREVVEQLLEALGAVGEEVSVRVHELLEVLAHVIAATVLVEHRVEIGEHVLQCLLRLRCRRRLQSAGEVLELLVEHVAAQHLADLVVRRPALRGAPVVVSEFADGARRVLGQHVERGLAEARVVGGIREEGAALMLEGFLELLADLLEEAVETAGLLQLAAALLQPTA